MGPGSLQRGSNAAETVCLFCRPKPLDVDLGGARGIHGARCSGRLRHDRGTLGADNSAATDDGLEASPRMWQLAGTVALATISLNSCLFGAVLTAL
jgi:hypothetical protein